MGGGYSKVPTPWPGQNGGGGTPRYLPLPPQPRYLPPGQVRTGVPKVPTPTRLGWGRGTPRYLPTRLGWGRGYPKVPTPWPGQNRGTQGTYPHQVRMGEGYPKVPPHQVRMGEGVLQDTYPPPRSGWGDPPPPPPPHRPGQGSCGYLGPRTCFTAGGMPLAFTQEDFLVTYMCVQAASLLIESRIVLVDGQLYGNHNGSIRFKC